jgi:hypothetical protein
MRLCLTTVVWGVALGICVAAHAEEPVSVLQLDGLSYISLEGREVLGIPAGSTIGFRFGKPSENSIPFTIQPSDVSIPPISTSEGDSLVYSLGGAATGVLQKGTGSGPSIHFTALVTTTLHSAEGASSASYSLTFTTETTSAKSADGLRSVAMEGMKLVDGARYLQLVGAVTNRADAYKEPGVAVSTVLSGTFDQLPAFR